MKKIELRGFDSGWTFARKGAETPHKECLEKAKEFIEAVTKEVSGNGVPMAGCGFAIEHRRLGGKTPTDMLRVYHVVVLQFNPLNLDQTKYAAEVQKAVKKLPRTGEKVIIH